MKNKVLHDIILAVLILVAAALIFFLFNSSGQAGESFSVYVRGELYGEYSLSEDGEIEIDGMCTISVSDRKVSVVSANCPGKNCVHHAPISKSGEIICCAPNAIIIRVNGESQYDFIV